MTAIYGVPRGGSMVAELVINAAQRDGILLTRLNEHEAHHSPDPVLVVDDLVDSGRTRDRVMKRLPGHLFDTLVTKNNGK